MTGNIIFLCGLNQILHSVISSFCFYVDENCALLSYDTVRSGNLWPCFETTFLDSWPLKMGLIGCPECQ